MSQSSHTPEWYLFQNDQQIGPLTFEELKEFHKKKPLDPKTLYWHEGMEEWLVVNDVLLDKLASSDPKEAPSPTTQAEPVKSKQLSDSPEQDSQKTISEQPIASQHQKPQPQKTLNLGQALAQQQKSQATAQTTKQYQTPASSTVSATPIAEVAPEKKYGLGGWMLVVTFFSVLFLLLSLGLFIYFGQQALAVLSNQGLGNTLGKASLFLVLTFGLFGALVMLLWSIYLNLNLFNHKPTFPSMFRATLGMPLLLASCIFLFLLLERWGITQFTKHLSIPYQLLDVPLWGLTRMYWLLIGIVLFLFLAMGLSLYLSRSKRVKNTFFVG